MVDPEMTTATHEHKLTVAPSAGIRSEVPFKSVQKGPVMRSTFIVPVSNRLLSGLPQAEMDELRPYLTRVRLVAGQVLIERGRAPEHVFFIEEGIASLVAETESGQLGVQVGMIGREGMVGGLALLDGASPAYACGVMQIPGPALRVRTGDLLQCMQTCPVLREVSLRFLQSLTRQVMSIAASNARKSLAERCVSWLLMAHERLDGDDLPVTHEALSVMLGVRRSGVTVATTFLQKAGLIRTSRGRIRILDRAGLEAISSHGLRSSAREVSDRESFQEPTGALDREGADTALASPPHH